MPGLIPFVRIPDAIWYRLLNHGPVTLITSGHGKNVNVPDRTLHAATKRAGVMSGRDQNKFSTLHLKTAAGLDLRTPHLKDVVGFVECRVVKTVSIAGVHVVMGRVLGSSDSWRLLKTKGGIIK